METMPRIMLQPEADKATSWVTNNESEQLEVSLLKEKLIEIVNYRYNQLPNENKEKLDSYIEVHHQLEPLIQNIESQAINLNIEKVYDAKESILGKVKSEEHYTKIQRYFDSLDQALDGTNQLYTRLSLFGTRTHRITTKRFNVQGLPKVVQQTILPSQFKKVYNIDFKSFEPSVVAYMTQDSKLIDFLNQKDGLYDALLSELDLPDEQRVLVKRAFIGAFLFGGNFNSPKFKLNQYISEVQWLAAVSQFTNVIELKKQVEKYKTMPMPYGVEHDMRAFQGSSIMAIYVQTVASYVFKHILLEVYKAQCEEKNFKIIMPIHDAITIECEDEEVAQSVAQLMKNTANQVFNGDFAHVTVEAVGGISNE
ncbi:DNA polymerase [Staphylococcus gallinarum]|uniref:DNA polymerase n=1 Tax=Staphylococcus gallinarum TaxID=1293 RepID=UPI002DBDEC72|nr:DNA polymerase [Staphylococcus gallinarum]MEB7038709.1 hypothetical protein [Staphylococcus gallinarum]